MRPFAARLAALLAFCALAAAQHWWHSPGEVSYGEFHILALASIPTMTVILTARWVDDGRRDYDR